MAQYVLAGISHCPDYARAELLADNLSLNLPDFKVHKITLSEKEWSDWLSQTCKERGWKHSSSPLVWRELVDRGGEGTYLGGWHSFKQMSEHWYGFTDQLDDAQVKAVSAENKNIYDNDKAASVKSPLNPVNITILNAANPLAYQILPTFLNSCFAAQPISFTLCDDDTHSEYLKGCKMELFDCAFDDLHAVHITSNTKQAVKNADFIIIIDHLDHTTHPDKFKLLKAVNGFYKTLANDLKGNIKLDSKIVINGSKGCLGGMLLLHHGVNSDNISVVLTLDEQRMRSKLAKRLHVLPEDISDIVVWGNVPVHSIASTVIATIRNHEGAITGPPSYKKTVAGAINEDGWETQNVDAREIRDHEILKRSSQKPYMSSSLAVYRHVEGLVRGSNNLTMGIISTGQYDTTPGVVFGFPVQVSNGVISVRDIDDISDKIKELVVLQDKQLQTEKQVALGQCDDVEEALKALEQSMWTILETPKLKRDLEAKEAARIAAEEAERKAAEQRAKEEAKKKAEEEATRLAEEEAAAALAAEESADGEGEDNEEEEEEE